MSEQLDGWNGAQVLVQPVVEAVFTESTGVTEGWGDADMPQFMMVMCEDAAEPSHPELAMVRSSRPLALIVIGSCAEVRDHVPELKYGDLSKMSLVVFDPLTKN